MLVCVLCCVACCSLFAARRMLLDTCCFPLHVERCLVCVGYCVLGVLCDVGVVVRCVLMFASCCLLFVKRCRLSLLVVC